MPRIKFHYRGGVALKEIIKKNVHRPVLKCCLLGQTSLRGFDPRSPIIWTLRTDLFCTFFQGEVEIDDDDLSTFEVRTVVIHEFPYLSFKICLWSKTLHVYTMLCSKTCLVLTLRQEPTWIWNIGNGTLQAWLDNQHLSCCPKNKILLSFPPWCAKIQGLKDWLLMIALGCVCCCCCCCWLGVQQLGLVGVLAAIHKSQQTRCSNNLLLGYIMWKQYSQQVPLDCWLVPTSYRNRVVVYWLSWDRHKGRTHANHTVHRHYSEAIETRSKYI